MSINDQLDSVVMKRAEGSSISTDDHEDDFVRPPRPARDADDLDMDITPMIDITFLLLIFFLVSSTPDTTTPIKLPQAMHGDSVSQRFSTMIYVGQGGFDQAPVYRGDSNKPFPNQQFSSDSAVREDEINAYIREGIAEGKTDVVIKADRTVPCRDIDGVLKAVSKVEGVKIHLGVLEPNS